MHQLEPGAMAKLDMVSGNMVGMTEMQDILSTYGFVQDAANPDRYDLLSDKAEDAGAGLLLSQEGESVHVLGEHSKNNILRLSYILSKFGWITSAQLAAAQAWLAT